MTEQHSPAEMNGILTKLLYLVLFVIVFWVCLFILAAVVIFQFVYHLLNGEKHDDVTRFAGHFSTYLGQISAYLTLASEHKPFPFENWPPETGGSA